MQLQPHEPSQNIQVETRTRLIRPPPHSSLGYATSKECNSQTCHKLFHFKTSQHKRFQEARQRNKKQSRLGKQYGKLNCLLVFVLCLSPYTQHPPPHTSSCASTALCSLLVGQGGWCSAPETAVWRWHLSLRAAACYKYRQRLPAVLPSDNYSWEWVGKQLIWALRDGRRRENLVLKERLGWVADWCILCHNQSTHPFIQMQGTPKVFLYTHFVSATKKKKRKPTRYSEQYWRYKPLVMLNAMRIPR